MLTLRSLLFAAAFAGASAFAFADDDEALAKKATWISADAARVRAELFGWLDEIKAAADVKERVTAHWPEEGGLGDRDLLDVLVGAMAIVEPRAKEIVDYGAESRPGAVPVFAVLQDPATADFVKHNLRLYFGRSLVRRDFADEGLEILAGLEPTDVADPASLYFYQAVAHHRLLDKEKCLAAVEKLLENEEELPLRFVRLAHLMAADIQPLKKDSLDEVARMMEDVRRRLNKARAGKKVRDEEEEIVAKLDKMIEDLEKQRQQQQQQQSGNAANPNPANPMQDSKAAELKGPGEVDIKNLGKKSGWGNLPPKERQEALQQIGKELPAHFRETIEEYFQRLAQDGVK